MRKINLQLFGAYGIYAKRRSTDSQPKAVGGDAERNIYNSILNNGGSTDQAKAAVYNYTGGKVSNYQTSDNAYANKGGASFNHYGTFFNKGGNNVTDLYNLEKLRGNYSFQGVGGIGAFKPSQAYTDAMNLTNSLLSQLTSGRTAYSDKVDALMSKIEGREKFSYDFNKDPLFQNALASAMSSGQTAMQDTMGQAAALTGGYGSSYATSAANQAYNDFVKGAYEQLPEYYQLARDAYNQEGQELYNQLGMYQTADNTAYGRLADAYSANLANAQSIYNQEYSNYWDTANYNMSAAKYNADLKYKYDSLNADRQQYYAKLKADSANGVGGTSGANGSGGASSISSSEWNSLKSDLKTAVEKYGADSTNIDQFIYNAANRYNLSDDDIRALGSLAQTYNPQREFTVKPGTEKGQIGVYDQYGRRWSGDNVTFTLKETKPTESNNVYVDNYGNEWTKSQIVANGWSDRIADGKKKKNK